MNAAFSSISSLGDPSSLDNDGLNLLGYLLRNNSPSSLPLLPP